MLRTTYTLIFVSLILVLSPGHVCCQTPTVTVAIASDQLADLTHKREFRGVWVATVANIDWPLKPGLPTDVQKAQLLKLLDEHQKSGINAIMFQIRPVTDAYYARGQELWSRYLTGKQGLAPDPFYDPLDFAITEAHKRGMELHAWFNPYRATMDAKEANTNPKHITRTRPGWFFSYGGMKVFNPGIPEVRNYIVGVIMNVVRNYDIDGVHFDDYFYPYKIEGINIPDESTYKLYGAGYSNIKDWRRQNVDTLIHTLSDSIHAAKYFMKFGISPFGIWKNIKQDPEGSKTDGGSSYLELYADSRKWVKKGWIDYVNPQIYWPFQHRLAAFENLLEWWGNNAYERHLYIGQAVYRAAENSQGFRERNQIPRQIRALRENPKVQGSVFFSSKSLTDNLAGVQDSLRFDLYKNKALQPQMPWLDAIPPHQPPTLSARVNSSKKIVLTWGIPTAATDGERAYGYVIYRFNEGEEVNVNNSQNILKISFNGKETTFTDESVRPGVRYTYAVTAIDRLKNESLKSPLAVVEIK